MDKGLPLFPISMNVSRVHFRSNKIIPYVEKLMEEYKVPTEFLEFELTENIYMNNFNTADDFINSCREHGIRTSMDDFGSGYSSLNLLSRLPIDVIKLDKVFLKDDNLQESDKIIISCVVDMAKKLRIVSLCEGVETIEQSDYLKEIGCQIQQGYYFSKPVPQEQFEEIMDAEQVRV